MRAYWVDPHQIPKVASTMVGTAQTSLIHIKPEQIVMSPNSGLQLGFSRRRNSCMLRLTMVV
jgi:hypothetical protein